MRSRFGLLTFVLTACATGERAPAPTPPTPIAAPPPEPLPADPDHLIDAACVPGGEPRDVAAILRDPSSPCRAWVSATYGRVYMQSKDSAVVWARSREGLGVVVSAAHSMGQDSLGPAGSDIPELLGDASKTAGLPRLYPPARGGTIDEATTVPLFMGYHPEIPAAESGEKLTKILPAHDFYVGLVDGQRLHAVTGLGVVPGPMQFQEEPLHDPLERARRGPFVGVAAPGDPVLIVGYPAVGSCEGKLCASVGRVLDDAAAVRAVDALRARGDEEGAIPYDPRVEMLVEGRSAPGMSGGGAFDASGRLVGVLVRGSDPDAHGAQVVRFVRTSYVADRLRAALAKAQDADREALARLFDFVGSSAAPAQASTACAVGALRLEMDPMAIGKTPLPKGAKPQTLLSLDDQGGIELAIAPGKATFELDPAGCLTFQNKLVAELLPDGRILSVTGEPLGTLRGRTLALTHSTIAIAESGAVTQTPSPGLPPERFVGLDPNETCAAAMLIIALGESASGASMAVVDGVAKRLPPAPPEAASRCKHVVR